MGYGTAAVELCIAFLGQSIQVLQILLIDMYSLRQES